MADTVDPFGIPVEPPKPPPVTSPEWFDFKVADVKASNKRISELMGSIGSFNPDEHARSVEIADRLNLDPADPQTSDVLRSELRAQDARRQAEMGQLFEAYPQLHDWLMLPNNAILAGDDQPQMRLGYDMMKMATDRGNQLDKRPELGLVTSFGVGAQTALRRFGTLALAAPAWISAMGSGRQTGPDAPASQRWFDSLWDAQSTEDEARQYFQQPLSQRVSEAAGGLVGDPFTYAGIGVAAKLASAGTKTAVTGASLVAYGQEVASAYSDVARSNLSKGLSPYASPFQHVMVNLAGITTMAFEKVAGPVGELGFLNRPGGMNATRVILGGALSEGAEEATQTLFENSATGDPVYARDLAEAGLIGGLLGGGMGLPSGVSLAFAKAHQDIVKPAGDVAQSAFNAQNAATAMQSLAQSKLAQRAPQRLVNYAETLAGDKTYTVSKAEWDAIWTKVNKNPDQAAVAFDGRLVNDTYEFSAGRYLALGSMQEPAIQAGLVEVFSSEGAPALNKALEIMAELEQRAKDIKPATLPSGVDDNSADIEDTIYQQMVSTGATKTNAKGTAQLIARHYVRLAEEMNAGRTEGKLTPKELYDFKPVSFGVTAPGATKLDQPAYHGTGNTAPYDRFAYERVGGPGGEGAQAYGWGLYFTSMKEVAQHYKEMLSAKTGGFKTKGSMLGWMTALAKRSPWAADWSDDSDTLMSFEQFLDDRIGRDDFREIVGKRDARWVGVFLAPDALPKEDIDKVIAWVSDNAVWPAEGKVYTVEIPEDSELLDWDKPLATQAQQDSIDSVVAKINDKDLTSWWQSEAAEDATGEEIYKNISAALSPERTSPAAGWSMAYTGFEGNKSASDALRAAGIPGIRYLGERHKAGKAIPNYVIFEDSKIVIKALEQRGDSKVLGDYDPVSGNVRLASKHNYSTALHESAHHFLTLLSFFENDKNAPAYFKEQMDRFRKWVGDNAKHAADEYNARNEGATVTADDIKNTPFTEEGRLANPDAWSAQHEYFARGFEEWLREGKTPDKEVRGLFAMFARWIKGVYKDLNILGVNLDDNSRQLFGRLFASQEMIDAANAEAERDTVSAELLSKMGLSPEEVATIQKRNREEMDEAFTKNVSRIARLMTKEDRDKRQALRDAAFETPEDFLTGPQGQAAIVNAIIGGDAEMPGASAQPGFGVGLDEASVRALLPPDLADKVVAAGKTATNGVKLEEAAAMVGANPIELAENMLTAPPWQEVVKQQIDAKELEAFGPVLTKDKAIELATEAAYGPERQSSARAMAKVVMGKIKKAGKLVEASTQIDIEAVEAAQYSLAEKLDRKELKPAKWRKLANQAAKDANRAITKGDAEAFAWAKASEAIALKRADIEEELADAYDKAEKRLRKFVETDGKEVSVGPQDYRIIALNMLAKFGIGQPVQGVVNPESPPAISPGIADATPGPVDSVLMMLELSNSLDNIIAAYKQDGKTAALAKGRAISAKMDEMEAQVVKTAGKRIQTGSVREYLQKWAVGPSLRLSSMLAVLDGGKPGVFTELGDAIRDAGVRMEQIRKHFADRLLPIIQKLSVSPQSIEGTDIKMSGEHKVMFAAHYGSETGRQRAIDHLRLRSGRKNVEADAKAILESMTKDEIAAVEEMWKINEELFAAVEKQHQEMRTAPPARIKHAPFKIGDRQMSGGYMTLRYLDKVFAKNIDEVADDTTVFNDGMTPSASSEKARKDENVGELDLNTNVMLAHIGEVSRVLAKRPIAKDIKRLFHANKGVIQRVNEKRGSAFAKQLQDLLSLSIVGTPPPQSGVERAALMLRRNVTASALMFNLNSALSQVLGIPAAISETSPKAFAYALSQYLANPVELRKDVKAESAMMRDRMGFADVNMHDVHLAASKSKFLAPLVNKGFWPIQIMQGEVDLLTYVAAKEKSQAENPGKPNEFHVKAAERAVKSSQGGASDTDLTLIQSGNIGRLISVFATAFNNMVNQYYVAGATGDYKKLASHVFWLAGVTTVAMMAMEALRGGAPEDEEYLDWYMKNTIGHMLDLNPMTRLFRGTIQDGREAQVAAMRPPIAAAKAAYNATQGEWDRAGRNMVKALPMVGPFPTVAAIRAFEGAAQIVDGDHVEGARHATLGTANPEKRK